MSSSYPIIIRFNVIDNKQIDTNKLHKALCQMVHEGKSSLLRNLSPCVENIQIVPLKLRNNDKCDQCAGTGMMYGHKLCTVCMGSGKIGMVIGACGLEPLGNKENK